MFSLKVYVLCLSLAVSLLVTGFLSCSGPGVGVYQPQGGLSSRASRSGSSDTEDEGEESVAECDTNTCEDTCREIYEESWSKCNDENEDTVASLQWVFNRLNSAGLSKRELEKISDDDDALDDFKSYLEIGIDGWLNEIEATSGSYSMEDATAAIEWLIENENVSEVLNTLDEGDQILKALVNKAIEDGGCPADKVCLYRNDERFYPGVASDLSNRRASFFLSITGNNTNPNRGAIEGHITIKSKDSDSFYIYYYGEAVVDGCTIGSWCKSPTVTDVCTSSSDTCGPQTTDSCTTTPSSCPVTIATRDGNNGKLFEIDFDSAEDSKLYRHLSAVWAYPDKDIFTAAADEDNPPLFDLAFSLLDDICENLDKGGTEETTACRKSLMCILAMHDQHTKSSDAVLDKNDGKSNIEDWDGWEMISDLDLENKLGDDFDECTKEAFDEDNL